MCKGYNKANGAVAAHTDVTDVIEKDYASDTACIYGLDEKRAHRRVRGSWLIGNRGTVVIELVLESVATHFQRAATQIGTTRDHDASRLTAGVGINDSDAFFHRAILDHRCKQRNKTEIGVIAGDCCFQSLVSDSANGLA